MPDILAEAMSYNDESKTEALLSEEYLDNPYEACVAVLQTLVGQKCQRSLATNSIKFRFNSQNEDKGHAYIWIDPTWRLMRDGKLVTGSRDWPVWDGVEDKETNEPLWKAWCALFDPLNDVRVTNVQLNPDCPDLHLYFESGYKIETFGNDSDEFPWWYYKDHVTGVVFEAGKSGITQDIPESL